MMAGRRTMRTGGTLGASMVVLIALLALAGTGRAESAAVAVVNGVEIPRAALDQAFNGWLAKSNMDLGGINSPALHRRLQRKVLERMVEEELLWQAAQDQGISVDEAVVDARVRAARRESDKTAVIALYPGEPAEGDARRRLQAHRRVIMEAYIREHIEPGIEISADEVAEFYERRRGENAAPLDDETRGLIRQVLRHQRLGERIQEHLQALHESGDVEIRLQ